MKINKNIFWLTVLTIPLELWCMEKFETEEGKFDPVIVALVADWAQQKECAQNLMDLAKSGKNEKEQEGNPRQIFGTTMVSFFPGIVWIEKEGCERKELFNKEFLAYLSTAAKQEEYPATIGKGNPPKGWNSGCRLF